MNALVTSFKKNELNEVVYDGKKPAITTTEVEMPLLFAYTHYGDDDKVISGTRIYVGDIISIELLYVKPGENDTVDF